MPAPDEQAAEENLSQADQIQNRRLPPPKQARVLEKDHLAGVVEQQLGKQALIDPDAGQRYPCQAVKDAPFQRGGRIDVSFQPEAQPVETPGGGPSQQRTKQQAVYPMPRPAEACLIVVLREEANAFGSRDILPVAGTFANERAGIVRPEFERGGTAITAVFPAADRFSFAADSHPKADAGGVEKLLGLCGVRTRKIVDRAEP